MGSATGLVRSCHPRIRRRQQDQQAPHEQLLAASLGQNGQVSSFAAEAAANQHPHSRMSAAPQDAEAPAPVEQSMMPVLALQ